MRQENISRAMDRAREALRLSYAVDKQTFIDALEALSKELACVETDLDEMLPKQSAPNLK